MRRVLFRVSSATRSDAINEIIFGNGQFLHWQDVKKAQEAVTFNVFSHVTPNHNLEEIQRYGLQTQFGGSERGVSGLETHTDFKHNSQGAIHLGKDDDHWLFKVYPRAAPSRFYQYIFDQSKVPNTTLTVVLPNKPSYATHQATLEAQMIRQCGFFSARAGMLKLVEQGYVKKDWADSLPGRYKTGSIPAHCVFFQPLSEVVRKPGAVGADGFVSDEVLATLVPSDTLSRDEKLEVLRGALHDTNEPMYPSVR